MKAEVQRAVRICVVGQLNTGRENIFLRARSVLTQRLDVSIADVCDGDIRQLVDEEINRLIALTNQQEGARPK